MGRIQKRLGVPTNGGIRYNCSTISSGHGIPFEILVSKDINLSFSDQLNGFPQIWTSSGIPGNLAGVYAIFFGGNINYPTSGGLTDHQRHQRPAL